MYWLWSDDDSIFGLVVSCKIKQAKSKLKKKSKKIRKQTKTTKVENVTKNTMWIVSNICVFLMY